VHTGAVLPLFRHGARESVVPVGRRGRRDRLRTFRRRASPERDRSGTVPAVHGVPTMFIAMLEHPDFGHFRLDSLRTGIMAGAPCPPSLMQRVMNDMHCPEILIGYGETEASPLTHLTSRDDSLERRTQTVGKNLPHQEVKIIDIADEQTVPLGQIGEVCFRGYHIMLGYANDSKATAEAIDENGWLHSGNLGSMDADGYVRITGRLKEMIIRGGENIYPREITVEKLKNSALGNRLDLSELPRLYTASKLCLS